MPTTEFEQNSEISLPEYPNTQTPALPTAHDAIIVEHLNKTFYVRHEAHTLKRALLNLGKTPNIETFVALNDLSFRVPHGQTLAVIGANGSGKSTLLSLLARVYLPTSGQLEMYGLNGGRPRIAPLLELGAGLHPELDGIDNITYYGAMLGMNAQEIRERTPQIIDFAEIASKSDTIVRKWNDGAKLRLGFAIAVNTDPDILLVDEVLAVGDEAFQSKCYRLIGDMQQQGKTIVLVSHDLVAVERVANRVLWLHNSVLRMDGSVDEVLAAYRDACKAGS